MLRPALLLSLTLLLPACGALRALEGEPNRDVFELRAPPVSAGQCGGARGTELVVELPKARETLDSPRIMIRPSVLETQYLPDAIWGEPVPAMVQRLLVETLNNHDAFGHVGREPLGLAGDFALLTEISAFNAELLEKGALIRMTVESQLIREMDAVVVGRSRFEVTTESPSTRTADLIPAFDAAALQLITEMTAWTLGRAGANCR
ncbi:hypothetical protein G7044_09795 [Paracoccus sp. 12-3]|nr:hypothetical protein [Paracoccus xiamenensis]